MTIQALENASLQTNSRVAPRAGESAAAAGKQAGQGGAQVAAGSGITDSVQLSDRLDLTIGNKMLMSHMGQKLQAMFEEHGIDLGEHVGVDMSPQATAERIVDFATGFFEVYKQQNADSDKSEEELLADFESTIRGAIDQGYGEAIDILRGMEEMNEGVFEIAEQTYDLMQELLDDRFAELRGDDKDEAEDGLVKVEDHAELSVPVYHDYSASENESGEGAAADSAAHARRNIDVLA